MLVITNIEYIEVEKDIHEIYNGWRPHELVAVGGNTTAVAMKAEVVVELLKGRRFRRPSDGTEVVIGATVAVQKTLGLMYEAWGTMAEELHDAQSANTYHRNQLRGKVNELENRTGTFWKRLKHLFSKTEDKS